MHFSWFLKTSFSTNSTIQFYQGQKLIIKKVQENEYRLAIFSFLDKNVMFLIDERELNGIQTQEI